jgi:iron(III) transport system substrate-binding protein
MKIGLIRTKTLLFLAALLACTSCLIETAKVPKKQHVVIYSDCLFQKDSTLFNRFKEKQKISVKIIHFPFDSILSRVKRKGFNSRADLIILRSLFDTEKAKKLALFQPFRSDKLNELVDRRYRSNNHTWYGIGIDPSVLIARHDTLSYINDFQELLYAQNKEKWFTDLECHSELIPILAPVFQNKKRKFAHDWYANFLENDFVSKKEKDKNGVTLMTTDLLLTYYSSYAAMSNRNDSTDFQLELNFSNQKSRGAYYNLISAGIVYQARNYDNAKKLLEYLASTKMNERINNRWSTFPISMYEIIHPYAYQNTYFQIFKGYSAKLMVNYPNIQHVLEKTKRAVDKEKKLKNSSEKN